MNISKGEQANRIPDPSALPPVKSLQLFAHESGVIANVFNLLKSFCLDFSTVGGKSEMLNETNFIVSEKHGAALDIMKKVLNLDEIHKIDLNSVVELRLLFWLFTLEHGALGEYEAISSESRMSVTEADQLMSALADSHNEVKLPRSNMLMGVLAYGIVRAYIIQLTALSLHRDEAYMRERYMWHKTMFDKHTPKPGAIAISHGNINEMICLLCSLAYKPAPAAA